MSDTYTTWLAKAANLAGTTITNSYFLTEAPAAIDYAEQRLYRDLDLISTITRDTSQMCAPGFREIAIPVAFVTVQRANIITPAGATPNNGTRNQLDKVSPEFLDFAWPSNGPTSALPTKFAILSQATMLLGPWPDQGYVVEIIGTQRPAPLSPSNATTFLTTNLADIFLTATMIHIAGYQKNFGAQGDDPRTAVSWEMQYKEELASADAEELRKRYAGTAVGPPAGLNKAPAVPAAAGRG